MAKPDDVDGDASSSAPDEGKTMTRSDLIERLAARNPRLSTRDADDAVKTMLDAMSDGLAQGHRIEIRGFGSFSLSYRPPRIGRNPKSGERVHVPAKHVPHFKAGKEMRERVDQLHQERLRDAADGDDR